MTTDYVATKLFDGIAEGSFYIIVNPETGDMQQDLMAMYIKSRHDGIQASGIRYAQLLPQAREHANAHCRTVGGQPATAIAAAA